MTTQDYGKGKSMEDVAAELFGVSNVSLSAGKYGRGLKATPSSIARRRLSLLQCSCRMKEFENISEDRLASEALKTAELDAKEERILRVLEI